MKRIIIICISIFILCQNCFAGLFLVNFYIRDISREQIIKYLKDQKINGFLIEQNQHNGFVLCEAKSEAQEPNSQIHFAQKISKQAKCTVLYNFILDSDVYVAYCFDKGTEIFEYNSRPGYFEGTDEKPYYKSLNLFCNKFKISQVKLKMILDNDYGYAEDGLADLAKLINAPMSLAYSSYSFKDEVLQECAKTNQHFYEIDSTN